MASQTTQPTRKVHLVGSIPLTTTNEVFTRLSRTFSNRLLRIPDGETGKRDYFVRWQISVFSLSPSVLKPHFLPEGAASPPGPINLQPVEYDDYALESYKEFCALRDQGVIPPGVRFQVSLPTPLNVIALYIKAEHAAEVEALYEKLLLAASRKIQDNIPKEDLAIQWDCALEFGMLEGVPFAGEPWFSPLKEGIVERMARLGESVGDGVQMGYHLCYGDVEHSHFVQPKDMRFLVEMANLTAEMVGQKRDVNWVHMPVPRDRVDEEYFAPLKSLKMKEETELYLGLAHGFDLDGARKRIEVAGKILGERQFGVATECGMGRTPKEEFESVMGVLDAVSQDGKNF
jgi:hypothetical protein